MAVLVKIQINLNGQVVGSIQVFLRKSEILMVLTGPWSHTEPSMYVNNEKKKNLMLVTLT